MSGPPGIRPEVADLIGRMKDRSLVECQMPDGTVARTSQGSVSWHAYEEADRLTDPEIAEELGRSLHTGITSAEHGVMCVIIGRIGRNTGDPRCTEILINRLRTAKRFHDLGHALGALAHLRKPASMDIAPITALLHHPRGPVVSEAVLALNGAEHPEAEDALLALTTDDRHVRPAINSVLGRIGTPKSLPMLEACLRSRTVDTRISAEFAIDAIRSRFPATA